MEEGLIIGYDLCQDYCRVSYYKEGQQEPEDLIFSQEQNPYLIQNAVCKMKGEDRFLIGQEAYGNVLLGNGMVVDKILRLVKRDGFASFEGKRYEAEELLLVFLQETLQVLFRLTKTEQIRQIVFSVQELDPKIMDAVIHCMKQLKIDRRKVHIISHTESYLYFVLSQKRELWTNLAVLYDLSGEGLNYYELEIMRGFQPNAACARRTFLEEGFFNDVPDDPSGRKMADTIMTSCVERMLDKKIVSSAYLSGKGMDSCQKWGENFLRVLCNRRRVFFIENLFAKGAVYAACEYERGKSAYPFRIMCEGRITVDITMDVTSGINQKVLTLAKAGDNWYETTAEYDIIPDREKELRFRVKKINERSSVWFTIPLAPFGDRENKLMRLSIQLKFSSENEFTVTVRDKGFGEFVRPSGQVIEKSFTIG